MITDLQQWQQQGSFVQVDGKQVFVFTAGDKSKPSLLILHGFPSFSYDYVHVVEKLSQHFYLVIHDHIGFGLSDKPKHYAYSFVEQADIALGVWRQLGISKGHLLAHDYGTSVATELIHRQNNHILPITISSLTLCNGSVHIELAELRLAQKILRLPGVGKLFAKWVNRNYFAKQIRNVFYDANKVSEAELDVFWQGLIYNQGQEVFAEISQYTKERFKFWHRWIGGLRRSELPTHILWADKDKVAVPAIAEALQQDMPHAQLNWLNDVGHFPMIEAPERWSEQVLSYLLSMENA